MEGTGEILKSGALTPLTDLVKTLAGPAFEELGAMFADNVRVYRVKNLIKTTEKTKRILADAGLQPTSVPSRLLLPLLDNCSVEDDDDLQERWAGLLASASQESDSLSPSFIETLKQLTPKEAKHCDDIFEKLAQIYKREPTYRDSIPHHAFTKAWEAPTGASETYERLGLIQRDYEVKLESRASSIRFNLQNMKRTVDDIESAIDSLQAEVEYEYCLHCLCSPFLKGLSWPLASRRATIPLVNTF